MVLKNDSMNNPISKPPQPYVLFPGSLLSQQHLHKPVILSSSTKTFLLLTHPHMKNTLMTKWKQLLEQQGESVIVLGIS